MLFLNYYSTFPHTFLFFMYSKKNIIFLKRYLKHIICDTYFKKYIL
jgi:hypothetical protein